MRRLFLVASALVLGCSGEKNNESSQVDGGEEVVTIDTAVTETAVADSAGHDATDATDAITAECELPAGTGTAATNKLVDGTDEATVTVSGAACKRTFTLSSTAPLRDSLPGSPRTIAELDDRPRVRTKNELFDALYALAQVEA